MSQTQWVPIDANGNTVVVSGFPEDTGQATMAESLPVVIASDQSPVGVNILTMPEITLSGANVGNVTISNFPNPLTVNGTVTLSGNPQVQVSNFPAVQPVSITNLPSPLTVNGSISVSSALPTGTNVIGHVITDTGSTTVVTGNVTAVQATGSNLHTVIDSGNITANIPSPLTVNGAVTLSGNPNVNVLTLPNPVTVNGAVTLSGTPSVSVSNFPAVQIVALSGLPNGQSTMANSVPVTIASDQTVMNMNIADFSIAMRNAFISALSKNPLLKMPVTGQLAVNQFPAVPVYLDQVSNGITIAAVTTLNNLNSIPIRDAQITPAERTLWQLAVRNRIS